MPFVNGKPSHQTGFKHSANAKDKIRYAKIGEKNPMWKGNEVGYFELHNWVKRHKPKPELCEECHKVPPHDLANISGKYLRDINDFRWLCRRCHNVLDRKTEISNPLCLRCLIRMKRNGYTPNGTIRYRCGICGCSKQVIEVRQNIK